MDEAHPEKQRTYFKIRKIDDDLKSEYFKLVEETGAEVPSVIRPKAPVYSKEYKEELAVEKRRKAEEEKKKKEEEDQ